MMNHIENLRAKPDHIKKKVAFFTSLTVTLIIFVSWIISNNVIYSKGEDVKIDTPTSSLSANVSGFFSSIKNIFKESSKNIYTSSDIEVTPGNR